MLTFSYFFSFFIQTFSFSFLLLFPVPLFHKPRLCSSFLFQNPPLFFFSSYQIIIFHDMIFCLYRFPILPCLSIFPPTTNTFFVYIFPKYLCNHHRRFQSFRKIASLSAIFPAFPCFHLILATLLITAPFFFLISFTFSHVTAKGMYSWRCNANISRDTLISID